MGHYRKLSLPELTLNLDVTAPSAIACVHIPEARKLRENGRALVGAQKFGSGNIRECEDSSTESAFHHKAFDAHLISETQAGTYKSEA